METKEPLLIYHQSRMIKELRKADVAGAVIHYLEDAGIMMIAEYFYRKFTPQEIRKMEIEWMKTPRQKQTERPEPMPVDWFREN